MEGTLDAFATGNLAHDEAAVEAAIALGNHHAFVSLHALAGTFDHADAHNDCVARREFRNFFAETSNFLLLQGLNQVHDFPL